LVAALPTMQRWLLGDANDGFASGPPRPRGSEGEPPPTSRAPAVKNGLFIFKNVAEEALPEKMHQGTPDS
jgi:hypothetical protein